MFERATADAPATRHAESLRLMRAIVAGTVPCACGKRATKISSGVGRCDRCARQHTDRVRRARGIPLSVAEARRRLQASR